MAVVKPVRRRRFRSPHPRCPRPRHLPSSPPRARRRLGPEQRSREHGPTAPKSHGAKPRNHDARTPPKHGAQTPRKHGGETPSEQMERSWRLERYSAAPRRKQACAPARLAALKTYSLRRTPQRSPAPAGTSRRGALPRWRHTLRHGSGGCRAGRSVSRVQHTRLTPRRKNQDRDAGGPVVRRRRGRASVTRLKPKRQLCSADWPSAGKYPRPAGT
jgi:hypothetical protein